jgi:hypothetical protein
MSEKLFKSGRGGARSGAGRPKKADEDKAVLTTVALNQNLIDACMVATNTDRPNTAVKKFIERQLEQLKTVVTSNE